MKKIFCGKLSERVFCFAQQGEGRHGVWQGLGKGLVQLLAEVGL
jgi:hypothetical protein